MFLTLVFLTVFKFSLADPVRDYFVINRTQNIDYRIKDFGDIYYFTVMIKSDYEIEVDSYLVNKSNLIFRWNGTILHKQINIIKGKFYIYIISTKLDHEVEVDILCTYYEDYEYWWIAPTVVVVSVFFIFFCLLLIFLANTFYTQISSCFIKSYNGISEGYKDLVKKD